MKYITILVSALLLVVGCNTTKVTSDPNSKKQEPAKLKVGMTESEILSILGEPRTKSSKTWDTGAVVETWFYRNLLSEAREIQHTGIETTERINNLTGVMEEVVVPVESMVTRTLHQELTIMMMDGKVISLDSKMDVNVLDALN